MRIVGGSRRGTRLAEPGAGDPAARLRPTSDRAREALFNLLAHGPYGDPVTGARVLDLFAGTGALGLEALSRGAVHAAFVETGRPALALLAANIARLRAAAETEVIAADATRLGPRKAAPFGLVFLDPPYGRGLGEQALAAARAGGWLAPGALVAWEEGGAVTPPAGFALLDARRYGAATLTLLRSLA
ncbi:16S rRNA (guanine(966)-N(2))-methyltransferase RsmD [Amaricoccus sp.]|uniref:16S rRNA (guanine(966)-N(2))-methyltransferase RsmD n=1 Tax=Amaricoccus sp. TaxID=1872485 RepID=UPI001B3ED66F|nr:16S rRNA (guanine(966)-N(2))-methyltransferase RsmD [Amaricoccus sp.]MBP7002445.1 16S rRNA (guanine(966)-N(2))-methyltransferase RsmD [Amaricoccus sp.]